MGIFSKIINDLRGIQKEEAIYCSDRNIEIGFEAWWDRLRRGALDEYNIDEKADDTICIKVSEFKRLTRLAYVQRHIDAKKLCEASRDKFVAELP